MVGNTDGIIAGARQEGRAGASLGGRKEPNIAPELVGILKRGGA